MRQVLSTAATAAVVSLLTLTVAGAMAQNEPEKERAVGPTGTNADRVDGKHAVTFTNARGRRAGKLVATNRGGWLPSNIVQPLWHLIKNKPAVLADGQVAWGEVAGKPPGFADNVDNKGVTNVDIKRVTSTETIVKPGTEGWATASCPPGYVVVGGGGLGNNSNLRVTGSASWTATGWRTWGCNVSGNDVGLWADAMCMSVTPSDGLTTSSKGQVGPAGKRGR